LAEHASAAERQTILIEHRVPLVCMGVMSGFVGAAPGALWASSSFFVLLAPVLIPLAMWLYALVFAFSSLWFTHYTLAGLERLRHSSRHEGSQAVTGQTVVIHSPSSISTPLLPPDSP